MLLFNVLFKEIVLCAGTVISLYREKILRSVRQKLIVISDNVISKIVVSGFCPIHSVLLQLLPGHSIFIATPGISRIVVSG